MHTARSGIRQHLLALALLLGFLTLIWSTSHSLVLTEASPGPRPAAAETGTTEAGSATTTPASTPPTSTQPAATPPRATEPQATVPRPAPKPATAPPRTTAPKTAPRKTAAAAGTHDLTLVLSVTFANTGTTPVLEGEVQVPLLAKAEPYGQRVVWEKIAPNPLAVVQDAAGNRFGRFSLAGLAGGQSLVVRQEYGLDCGMAAGGGPVPSAADREPGPKIESDRPEIVAIAAEIVSRAADDAGLVVAAYSKTRAALTYDSSSPARNQGALAALTARSGVCEEFASLFVAILRAAGLPARVVTGYAADRDSPPASWSSASGGSAAPSAGPGVDLRPSRHAWAEVYLSERGWTAVDPTYGRSRLAGIGAGPMNPGVYIVESYGGLPITGQHVGGQMRVTRSQTLLP